MRIPPSPHFTPISLQGVFNADRATLGDGLGRNDGWAPDWSFTEAFGERVFHGIPFALGQPEQPNVILLTSGADAAPVRIDLGGPRASYILFLHAVEDRVVEDPPGFGPMPRVPAGRIEGNERRRQGLRLRPRLRGWQRGEHADPAPLRHPAAAHHLGRQSVRRPARARASRLHHGDGGFPLDRLAARNWGDAETRHDSVRDDGRRASGSTPCPTPSRTSRSRPSSCGRGRSARSSTASPPRPCADHPLRPGVRRKLRLTLPAGVALNALGELDADSRDAGDRDRPGHGHLRPRRARLRRGALGRRRARRAARAVDQRRHRRVRGAPAGRLYVATGPDSHLAIDLPAAATPAADGSSLRSRRSPRPTARCGCA